MISDWSDLQTVMAIADEGTLTGAARRLGVSQSTMSRRLGALEARLDQPLFRRLADGRMSPSETGQVLIDTARRVDSVVAEANSAFDNSGPPMRLATCEVVAKGFVGPMLAEWTRKTHTPVDIAVHDDLFSLGEREFDILVTPLDSAPDDMVGRRIGSLKWRLYATPTYLARNPFDPARGSLDGHKVILASGSLAGVGAYRWLESLGGTPVLSASSVFAQRDMAESDVGIAYLPQSVVPETSSLVDLPVLKNAPESEVWMVARKSRARQGRIREFLDRSYRYFDSRNSVAS